MTYDPRKDALLVARLTRDEPAGGSEGVPLDVEAIIVGAIDSLNIVADWCESSNPQDRADAAELANYVIDDLEAIIGGRAGP